MMKEALSRTLLMFQIRAQREISTPSLLELSAVRLNYIAPKHWGIKNQLHWQLDVVFNEDKVC